MLNKEDCFDAEVKVIFSKMGAIIPNDHFVYTKKSDGWYHGSTYVNKDALYPYVKEISRLCLKLSSFFCEDDIRVVVGPTMGGIVLSQWVAYWLQNEAQAVHAVFAEEENDYRILKRGYDKIVSGKNCLVVEDIINSGGTVKKTIGAIERAGGKIAGVGTLCNRSGGKVTDETLGVPKLISLLNLNMAMHKEEDCPICKKHGQESVRIDIGKGKEFLARIGKLKTNI